MTDQIDIVQLIEKNPITHLSKDYQNELLTKIKTKFTNKEQQMFVASFYCFLSYSKTDFVIDLDDIWKWIGFSRKDPAKRLLEKFFVKDVDYKILLHQTMEQSQDHKKKKNLKGGHNKEQIIMTVNTFKKFCLKAGTSKADEIHNYYINLEELLHETINEETTELRNQLSLKNNQLSLKDDQHKMDIKMMKHNTLTEILKTKNCIYIAEVKENKRKVGSSKYIIERGKELNKEYGNLLFLDIFECERFREVEENILKDPIIIKNLYKEPIKIDGTKSNEVVQLSNDFTHDQLLTIVKKHIEKIHDNFLTPVQMLKKQKLDLKNREIDLEKQKLDNELLLSILNNDKYSTEIQQIIKDVLPKALQNISINVNKEKLLDKKEELQPLEKNETHNPDYAMTLDTKIKGRKSRGRKVQKIDADNLQTIIKVYNSMIYLLRDPENKGFHKYCIQTAIKKNKIYKGFRWNFVEIDEDETITNIKPTVASNKPPTINSILRLNSTKTEILDSFFTKECLQKKLDITSHQMTKIITKGLIFNDHYYIEYCKCPQELLNKYTKPINRIVRTRSKQIKQINPITNETVLFNTLNEVSIKFGYTGKTIKDAIQNKTLLGGNVWQYYEKNNESS